MSDKRKVAVCGTAPSSLGEAPLDDPEWEIWGTSRLWKQIPRWDAWFEMHPLDEIGRGWNCSEKERKDQRDEHIEWLGSQDIPVYLQEEDERIPNGVRYPKEQVLDYMRREFGDTEHYYTNSISWMLAFAVYSEVDAIAIYGVDMALDSEYGSQRPSVEYWLGVARGAGIEVTVPDSCDLLQTSHLYGYEWDEGEQFVHKLEARKDELQQRLDSAKNQLNELAQIHAAAAALAENVAGFLENDNVPPSLEQEMKAVIQQAQQQAQQAKAQAEKLRAKRERLLGAQDNVEYIRRSFAGQQFDRNGEVEVSDADVIDFSEAGVKEAAVGG